MAPVIRDTVMDVNNLLMVIREQFPAHPPGGLGDTLSRVLEETGPGASSAGARRAGEAEAALQGAAQQLATQVTQLGEAMRSPQVMSDRWNLLAELQSHRARFREQIGDLVFNTALVFAEVQRKDVVPFFDQEVKAAVTVRGTVADLIRLFGSRLEQIREAEPEDVQWNATQLEKEMDSFGRTPAYRAFRAHDKRRLIELRDELRGLLGRPNPSRRGLLQIVEPFDEFVRSLAGVNSREMLLIHDREAMAECGVGVERAGQLLSTDPEGAAAALGEAIAKAQSLYGRDPELDAFLRKSRKAAPTGTDVAENLERLVALLANLQLY
ncbi:MAG: hypothetical protein HYZ28_07785 [Myxococcales bacterium]|nr:hypothetical protein [Myxococcales bacterium]